jgi:hypothetical protein
MARKRGNGEGSIYGHKKDAFAPSYPSKKPPVKGNANDAFVTFELLPHHTNEAKLTAASAAKHAYGRRQQTLIAHYARDGSN